LKEKEVVTLELSKLSQENEEVKTKFAALLDQFQEYI